ncbi:MAG: hypothetical protein OEZ32_00380 [Nitrospinota bacterium]|nr:hypothetical protein [Nitrospinota bacterium]
MTAILLWAQMAGLALLLTAMVRATLGRMSSQFFRDVVSGAWVVLLVASAAWAAFMARVMDIGGLLDLEPGWLYPFFFSMTIFLAAGGAFIFAAGGKKSLVGSMAAARWPISLLAGACAVMMVMIWVTVEVSYQFSLPRFAMIKSMAADTMIRILPPRPLEEENAATYYDKAWDIAGEGQAANDGEFVEMLKLLDKEDDEAWAKARAYIGERKDYLDLVKKGAAMAGYSYADNPALDPGWPGWESAMPRYVDKKEMAAALALEARLLAREKLIMEAVDNVELVYNLGGHTAASPPSLVSTLLGVWITDIGSGAVQKIIEENPSLIFAKGAAPVRYQVIDGKYIKTGLAGEFVWRRASLAEIAFDLEFLYNIVKESRGEPVRDPERIWSRDNGPNIAERLALKLYVIFGLEYDIDFDDIFHRRVLRLAEKSPPEFLKGLDKLFEGMFGQYADDFTVEFKGMSGKKPSLLGGALQGMMDYKVYVKRNFVTEARYYLAKTALAAQIYHARAERYPASLDDLAPDYITSVPIDPFDGKPLKMVSVEDGILIYSVGPDYTDNGGKTEKEKSLLDIKDGEDIVFPLGKSGQIGTVGASHNSGG